MTEVLDELPDANLFQAQPPKYVSNWYDEMFEFLTDGTFHESLSADKRKKLALKSKSFLIIARILYKRGIDQVIKRCVFDFEQSTVLQEAHQGLANGHFLREVTRRKIFQAGLWWPTVLKDAHNHAK